MARSAGVSARQSGWRIGSFIDNSLAQEAGELAADHALRSAGTRYGVVARVTAAPLFPVTAISATPAEVLVSVVP